MNLTSLGSRFRRPAGGLMRSHLAPCRPLRSLRLAHGVAVRTLGVAAVLPVVSAGLSAELNPLDPRRV